MATLGELSQQTVSPSGTTFDQGVNQVIAQEPGLRDSLGQGTSFSDMSSATRQLVAENAAMAAGDPNMINSAASQEFINGSAPEATTYGGSSGGSSTPSYPTTTPTAQGGITSTPASDSLTSLIEQRYGSVLTPGLTEQQILDQEMAKIQDQVDAINSIYTARIQQEQNNGLDRLGRGRSLNAVSGNAWNPFGEARTQSIEQQNKQVLDAINAEKAQELANLYAAARGETTRRVERQADQLSANTNAYIDQMVKAYSLSQEEADSLRADAARVASLTGYYNGSPTLDKQSQDFTQNQTLSQFLYQKEQDALANERANQQLDMQAEELRRAGYQVDTMQDGTVGYWDYSTGAPKFTVVGNYAKLSTSGGGGSGSEAFDKEAAYYRDLLVNGSLPWGEAYDAMAARYPGTSSADLNQALGGSVEYDPSTGTFGASSGLAVPYSERVPLNEKTYFTPSWADGTSSGGATTPPPY